MASETDKCLKIQGMLADYRTGALRSRECREIEEHISGCSECDLQLKTLDGVLELLQDNVPDLEPPAGLWNGVYNRIANEAQRKPAVGRIGSWLAKPLRAAGVTAAALVLAVGVWLGTAHAPAPNTAYSVRGPSSTMQALAQNEYVQGHALYAGETSAADQVSYLALAAASGETGSSDAK